MSSIAKREWNARISLEESLGCSIGWITRARQKNVLAQLPPTLYVAYVVDDTPPLGFMKDLTSLFRYSAKDDMEMDRARDQALRLLAVAQKAHFFMGRESLVRHEPHLFSIPDISQPSSCHYGLVYKLESRPAQTIIVSSVDLGLISTLKPSATRFPVVLTKNTYQWFDKKHWQGLAAEADVFERVMKPWVAKEELNIIEKWTDEKNFPFGDFLDIPFDLKDYMKPTGVRWADVLRKWYLPRGFDVAPVKEYLKWLETERRDHKEEFDARFWRIQPTKSRIPAKNTSASPSTNASGSQHQQAGSSGGQGGQQGKSDS